MSLPRLILLERPTLSDTDAITKAYYIHATPATYNVPQTASNIVEPAQISDHVSTVAQRAVGNSETPQVCIPSRNTTGNSISIDGAPLDVSDGAANSQAKDTDYDDTATSADGEGRKVNVKHYEEIRREPIEHEHEYDTMKESGMNVRLVEPTTLQCSKQVPSSCPDELSALTKDAAWHAHINDTTIHKVVKDLCACPAGTYIMWYSKKKRAMLVSVAVPEISKKHVHFKMVRTETEGVSRPHYHFDSRLHNKDPLVVLQYVKENGLVIKPAKLRHYQSQF
ncbi:hypothetical protein KP79_PYT11696 [Mizuhopecten yessoensis]|uniref:SH2 domain-containing protein n=1 Tax=Mizuhopecten yessoensis TaxID=6573 RepID=A0A210QSC1_MIZYE|nr:hypothetical protein KP79_PYT11696 [Mizuhopecten yessoensis]